MNLSSLKKSSLLLPALAVLIAASAGVAMADVQLPSIISDHMVLKKGPAIPIWGKAEPGEAVKVTLGDASAKATADASGKWIASLDLSESKAGPFTLNIAGKNQIAVNDVLVGEVWLASGQSNMAMMLDATIDAEKEIANSANQQIRQFRVERTEAAEPADNCKGAWTVAGPETAPKFSAVAYFFAKRLNKELGRPVGIINSSVGGTPCEAWTSPQAIDTVPHLKQARETALNALKNPEPPVAAKKGARRKPGRSHSEPSCLFNGMINPVIPYALSGAIWYQGEANAPRAWQYRTAFPLMITDWRTQWKQGDFPFYFCQLANFDKNKLPDLADSPWAELREAQSMALKLPNTGQSVLIDVGEKGDIHPRNKQTPGDRLAIIALANKYGRKIPFSGPVFQSKKIEGDKIRLKFSHTDGGLVAKPLPDTINVKSMDKKTGKGITEPLVRKSPNSELEGFAIRGEDKTWVWADAKIDGDSVVVWSDKVPKPLDVRYAWADYPVCNLYNKADLPACPFRTDEDPAVTRDVLY